MIHQACHHCDPNQPLSSETETPIIKNKVYAVVTFIINRPILLLKGCVNNISLRGLCEDLYDVSYL